ncbi:hypothetical protein LCGC14_2676170 [marine sediment metagenome]|uniref:Uncharacterized protein n=1 Tax=marine sediment metagenome TaxID=412755 RepID=A0A0F9BXM7_9ZZZZ
MEILMTSITHLPEILLAVMTVLGGQKGYEVYRKKKWSNGGRDRRSSIMVNNSFCQSDRDFIKGCFENQTKEMGMAMKNDRLVLIGELKDFIRSDGESTRVAVRER